jgi:hypothetical protein
MARQGVRRLRPRLTRVDWAPLCIVGRRTFGWRGQPGRADRDRFYPGKIVQNCAPDRPALGSECGRETPGPGFRREGGPERIVHRLAGGLLGGEARCAEQRTGAAMGLSALGPQSRGPHPACSGDGRPSDGKTDSASPEARCSRCPAETGFSRWPFRRTVRAALFEPSA